MLCGRSDLAHPWGIGFANAISCNQESILTLRVGMIGFPVAMRPKTSDCEKPFLKIAGLPSGRTLYARAGCVNCILASLTSVGHSFRPKS
jgi:hypothetical protein